MPTETQKARKAARAVKKAARAAVYEVQRKLVAELCSGATRAYKCACAYCQYRTFCVNTDKGDPGPNPTEAPLECQEAFTVRCRKDGVTIANPMQAHTRNRHARRALKHHVRSAV